MTTPALERAARAAQDEFWNQERDNETRWDFIARAVLMAVRETDEHLTYKAGWHSYDYSDQFAAMIDAILNEKDTTND